MKPAQIYKTERIGGGAPGIYLGPGMLDSRGIQAMSRGTQQVASSIVEFGQSVQTAVRLDLVSHGYAAAQRDVAAAEIELKADPDHRSIEGKFKDKFKGIREEYGSRIFDPVARNMFERKMLEYGTAREIQMKYYVFGRETEAQQAHLSEILHDKYDLIANLQLEDRKSYGIYLQEGFDAINERIATGMVSETAGVALRREFKEKAAGLKARQNIIIDAESAIEKLASGNYGDYFPGLNPETRLSLHESARVAIDREYRQEVELHEKIERMAAAEEVKRLGANHGSAVVLYAKGDLTEGFLAEAIEKRDLTPEKGYALIRRLREDAKGGKTEANNPEVVGDLARRLALGDDIADDLNAAMIKGDIKDQTFITMTANMAKEDVKRAYSYINKAMQPSEYEMDFNLKQTWADAVDLLNERIARGQDPMTSARDIVRSRRKRLPTPPAGRPRYLSGTLETTSLETAMRETVEGFRAGQIGPVEANQEIELIERHMEWLRLQTDADDTLSEMDKEIK